jgi:hypothetical protein
MLDSIGKREVVPRVKGEFASGPVSPKPFIFADSAAERYGGLREIGGPCR